MNCIYLAFTYKSKNKDSGQVSGGREKVIDFICLEKNCLYAKIAKQMRKEKKISEKVQR